MSLFTDFKNRPNTIPGPDGEANVVGDRVPRLLVLLAEVLGVEGLGVREEPLVHGDAPS